MGNNILHPDGLLSVPKSPRERGHLYASLTSNHSPQHYSNLRVFWWLYLETGVKKALVCSSLI